MKGRERAELRAEAHHLSPTVHVGQHGLTPTVVGSLDDALRTRERSVVYVCTVTSDRSERKTPVKSCAPLDSMDVSAPLWASARASGDSRSNTSARNVGAVPEAAG